MQVSTPFETPGRHELEEILMRTSSTLRRLSTVAAAAALVLLTSAAQAQPSRFDRIVSFGASLSDTGNAFVFLSDPVNQALGCGVPLSVPPYDMLDDYKVPDGPYATGGHHMSNGATWLEGLARHFALAGNARPALRNDGPKASNYATAGARSVDYTCRFNLPAQVFAYTQAFTQTSPATLVTMEVGGNDVRDALVVAAMGGDPTAGIQAALASLAGNVQVLYGHGARRFLLMNVPDVGKTPAIRQLAGQFPPPVGAMLLGAATDLSAGYNLGLQAMSFGLGAALPGIDIRILDAFATLNAIVANPAAYGLANVADACVTPGVPPFKCQQPDTFLFWDGIHPTKAVHEVLAQEAIGIVSAP
jgi:phospholipase/lecithinase/hemolysin